MSYAMSNGLLRRPQNAIIVANDVLPVPTADHLPTCIPVDSGHQWIRIAD